MVWLVMPTSGSCQHVHALSEPPIGLSSGLPGSIIIEKPVGRGAGARNLSDDVKVIQEALNQVTLRGTAGGTLPFLKVDGIIGPKTQAAIDRFQQVQLKIFDGLIEPAKKTIRRLNEILDPVSDADLQAKILATMPLVALGLTAALDNLRAIISEGPSSTGLAAAAADRLNRHFSLNTLSAFDQADTRIKLFQTYTSFSTVILDPAVIERDLLSEFALDKANPKFALTQAFGAFMTGQKERDLRLDRIRLGLAFFGPTVTPDFAAFIILHELAHFVGTSDSVLIDDFGRGWFDQEFIAPLPAKKRLANADCYATFAHECRTGSSVRPPFVKSAPGGLGGAR